ncbi:MAG: SgcJ/EcaC family oxidoreductase [Pirellulaceae bacterium]|nr:SgcJ/EcaC family oxidoreductase [Pirellulaceae bacterium]
MRKSLFQFIVVLLCSLMGSSAFADEAAVRKAIADYIAAFNGGDVNSLVDAWSDDAVWVNSFGMRFEGKENIAAELRAGLAGKATLDVRDVSIRVVAPQVVIEEGTAIFSMEGTTLSQASYEAVHVLGEKGWKIATLREFVVPESSGHPNLQPLAWMVGSWIDDSVDSRVVTHVEWAKNDSFLISNFTLALPDMDSLQGVQIIGWDAAQKKVRSWVFDSDGGHGEGTWKSVGNDWIVRSKMTLADGRLAESTNVYSPVDQNSYRWRSFGRRVGAEFLPNIENVLVVRAGVESGQQPRASDSPHQAGAASQAEQPDIESKPDTEQ